MKNFLIWLAVLRHDLDRSLAESEAHTRRLSALPSDGDLGCTLRFEELPDVLQLVKQAENELSGAGRVLLRYSGTEPKIRLLIEGRDGAAINAQADRIAGMIQEDIGV